MHVSWLLLLEAAFAAVVAVLSIVFATALR